MLFKINIEGRHEDKVNILVLNSDRFGDDLEAFRQRDEINILTLSTRFQSIVNSIFLGVDKSYLVQDFLQSSDPQVIKYLEFLEDVIKRVRNRYRLNCVLSCSFQYRQDFPIAFACKNIDLNFNVIFKEFMKDRSIEEFTINYYKEKNFKFIGNKIFLANNRLKDILVRSNVAKEEQAYVIGCPRFDLIFKKKPIKNLKKSSNQITLFSFLHGSGLVQLKNKDYYFTNDPNEGFYYLFKDVHEAFGELALENPDTNFRIKAKYADIWIEVLDKVFMDCFNMKVTDFENLVFDTWSSAQDLIRSSDAVISFNSTTLLEAIALETPVILPIFAEASGKYAHSNVYFRDFFQDLDIASSRSELKTKIKQMLNGNRYNYNMNNREKIFKEYIHRFDGNSTSRLLEQLEL